MPERSTGTWIMHQEERRPQGLLELRECLPFTVARTSAGLGWSGLEAARIRPPTVLEFTQPALPYHDVILFIRPPTEMSLRYEGVQKFVPPPAGAISVVPAGLPVHWRWQGSKDSLNVFLDPRLVVRVAAEVFDLDTVRAEVPPLHGLDLPQLRAALWAVDAELMAGCGGGQLATESLANLLAVHLIRHVTRPRPLAGGLDSRLPRGKLRAVVEYLMEHLDGSPTLEQLAAIAHLSPFHFARQFKNSTGLPPHQFLIAQRIERAKQLLQGNENQSLAEVALDVGFSDQSQFSRHFKRLVGVTPKQFRIAARTS
jgi:AraC family transcriptional regulator